MPELYPVDLLTFMWIVAGCYTDPGNMLSYQRIWCNLSMLCNLAS